jgi:uncharacterized protein YcbK (DUF882 family)
MAFPIYLLAPIFLLVLSGKRTGGGPPVVGPYLDQGRAPTPMYEGPADHPDIVALLQEMDDYFASAGIDTNVIDAWEVTRLRKFHRTAIPPREFWPRMAATIKYVFMPIRRQLGEEIVITSGYRTPEYNAFVGGAKGSRHQWFEALDMHTPPGLENQQAILAADLFLRYGDRLNMGLGIYGSPGNASNIHVDTGHKKRTWREAQYWIERAKKVA